MAYDPFSSPYDTSAAHGGRLLGEYRYASDFTPTGTGIAYAESTSYDDKTIETYDDSTTLPSAEQTDLGRVAQLDDYSNVAGSLQDAVTHYTYDPITGEQASIASPEGTIDYSYDPATGERLETSTDGTDTHYGYDSQERLQTVHVTELDGAAVDQTTTYSYDPAGNLHEADQPDDTKTVYTDDDLNRLTDEVVTNTTTNEPVLDDHYDLNADGTRQDAIETQYNGDGSIFAKTETNWGYDADGRLTDEHLVILDDGTGGTTNADGHAPTPYENVFKFDLANNRVEEDTTGGTDGTGVIDYTYNSEDQLLTETRTGSDAYAIVDGHTTSGVFFKGYDAWGDQVEQHRTGFNPEDDVYSWDLKGDMTSAAVTVSGTTSTTDYAYDSNGVRTSESTHPSTGSGQATYYLNDPNNPTGYTKAIEEKQGATAATATVSRSYVLGLKVEGQSDSTNGTVYFLTDGHGTTRALIATSGAVLERYDYDAFGTLLLGQHIDPATQAVTDVTAATAATPWLFGGDGLYDPSTGWTYQLARWRDGFRFTSADTFAGDPSSPISLHKYLFASGSPVALTDPSGHDGLLETLGTIGGWATFQAVSLSATYGPAISAATTIAGYAAISSGIYLALEQTGFVPQNDYVPYVFAVSSALFTAGLSLQAIGQSSVTNVTAPLRGSTNGQLIDGDAANNLPKNLPYSGTPPYAANRFAATGTIAPGVPLVRFYNPTDPIQPSQQEGSWVVPAAEVQGLTPQQVAAKYALGSVPTDMCDVNAQGVPAVSGYAGPNFGQKGGGLQIELMQRGATFSNPRPINGATP